MYAVHLGTGHSLLCKAIKSGTIATYCLNAAQFVALFDDKERDIRKTEGNSTFAPCYNQVLKELRRWEVMPNRREPYTLAMQRRLIVRAGPHSIGGRLHALKNWFSVMLQAGGRLGEWAQRRGDHLLTRAAKDFKGNPRAFSLDDVEFLGRGKVRLTLADALRDRSRVKYARIRWRTQKNGNNGEQKTFSRNMLKVDLDVVDSWLDIVERFLRLTTSERTDLPLSLYRTSKNGTLQLLTANDIESVMQSLAIEVYNLHTVRHKDDIARFLAHSLRVGACTILQAAGFAAHEIKFLLRWKSEAFMDYLRNLAVTAERQNTAVAEADNMPEF
jgi:hypothetical protein